MKKTFAEWLKANGYDEAAMSDAQKKHLDAAWRAETEKESSANSEYQKKIAALEEEGRRVAHIRKQTLAYMDANKGNPEKLALFRELGAKAEADEKVSTHDFDISLLRADRAVGMMITTPAAPKATSDVIEAAICVAHRLPGVEKVFSDQTLQAAHTQFRRGLGIQRLMRMGAEQNGYRGDGDDFAAVCRANLRGRDGGAYGGQHEMRADVSPSTGVQIPGILGNIANKFLTASFYSIDQSWRGIAKIRPVNNFFQTTTYRMAGNNTFLRVAPSGEIKHGALSESSYTNQAKTYGRLLGISREDYVNDDLGAFVTVAQELGRGGMDGLNNIFWATFLNDSTFFPTDKSKLNYDDGATDSVLSLAGLDNAESIFAAQTKPDGTFLGATPKILLVPPALKNTALNLMTPAPLVVGTTAATGPSTNVFAGRYTVISSPYLASTSLKDENGVSQSVSGSSTAWYLLADPMDIPAIEVVFLFGRDTPIVETGEFEFNQLGFATRAYFDFGVSLQEYRAGVKLKGAA